MKTILKPLRALLLLGILAAAFALTYRGVAQPTPSPSLPNLPTGKGHFELRMGIDKNGCESVEHGQFKKTDIDPWLRANNIPSKNYKLKYKERPNDPPQADGELELVTCCKQEGGNMAPDDMKQASGVHVTQRVIFQNTKDLKKFVESLQ